MPKGYLKVIEKVPVAFIRRAGDWVQEGGNNALIVLGTDRATASGPAGIDDGLGTVDADGSGKGTGTIVAVVGRKDFEKGGIDITDDDAFIYLSMKTKVDENLGTTFESSDTGPAAIVKSDFVRFVFRKNLKVSAVEKETHIMLDGDKLHVDMQGKAKISLDVSGGDSSAKIDVQDNTIEIGSDGTITITSKSQVVVNTKTAQVNCDTAQIKADTSVVIDAPDTTITKKLHVGGDAEIAGTTTITGETSILSPLTVAGAASVAGVVAVGGLSGPSGAPVPGGLTVAGDVVAGGGLGSLLMHTHFVPGVSPGPSLATALNIGASAATGAAIVAKKAEAEAAAEAAREAAARRAGGTSEEGEPTEPLAGRGGRGEP